MKTIYALMAQERGFASYEMLRMSRQFFRTCLLSGAISSGLLKQLSAGPKSFESLAGQFAQSHTADAFKAFLDFGVMSGDLRLRGAEYSLRSRLAKRLAEPDNDALAAMMQEFALLDYQWLTRGMEMIQRGQKFTLADQDGEIVARSSRVLEPLVHEAIDRVIPQKGKFRLLEIGCGSGTYLRYAMERNPGLEALGVELQPAVADLAKRNLAQWGMPGRAEIAIGDIRDRVPQAEFDAATLHNNIYYFPASERIVLIEHVARFLKPGGQLLITTACRGTNLNAELLNFWGAITEGCGPLPTPDELMEQLRSARLKDTSAKNILPMSGFYSFVGRK